MPLINSEGFTIPAYPPYFWRSGSRGYFRGRSAAKALSSEVEIPEANRPCYLIHPLPILYFYQPLCCQRGRCPLLVIWVKIFFFVFDTWMRSMMISGNWAFCWPFVSGHWWKLFWFPVRRKVHTQFRKQVRIRPTWNSSSSGLNKTYQFKGYWF